MSPSSVSLVPARNASPEVAENIAAKAISRSAHLFPSDHADKHIWLETFFAFMPLVSMRIRLRNLLC